MPDVARDSETTRSVPSLGYISSHSFGESVVLEISDGLGEKTSTDQEENSSRSNKEPMKGSSRTGLVNEVAWSGQRRDMGMSGMNKRTHDCTGNQAYNDSNRNRNGRDTERDLIIS